MNEVWAIVVTRNRKSLLRECVGALRAQTRPVDRILIVDSASTDGTEEALRDTRVLDDARVIYERLERNRGSAGGYGHGIERAASAGADWLWIMDDDAEPHLDALERLLAAPESADDGVAALAGAVVLPDGGIDPLHRGRMHRFMRMLGLEEYRDGHHPPLGFASYTGLFVRGAAARAESPPREEFFTWADDVEWTLRLRRHGEIRLVPESRVIHKAVMGGAAPTPRGRLWGRWLGAEYPSSPWEDYWKPLYGIRNFLWIKRHLGRPGALTLPGLIAAYAVKSLLFDDRPLRRLPWIVRFARAGWRGDFTGPTPEQWSAISARG
jgi:rhamnopyranosyl-N-acetylglucosaminyl-diphospho-decaprenol beta-1,3/1,4-galactofuranosyltransferase